MNLTVVDHKYLENGHTSMEVDTIHSSIETAKKSVKVYVPRKLVLCNTTSSA